MEGSARIGAYLFLNHKEVMFELWILEFDLTFGF